jgi:hypothetical protein
VRAAGLALCAQAALPEAGDDDLTVVKRAVAQSRLAQSPSAPMPKPTGEAPRVRRADKPQWLRVRIVEHGSRKRVSVNLPLALVRAVSDWPIDWQCGRDEDPWRRCKLRIGEVLEALDAGQSLVEIEDGGSTVRVWVE